MTSADCHENNIRRPLALNLAAGLTGKVSAVLRALLNRREMYHLGQMSDIELADIGLRRGDLYAVSDDAILADPTGRLKSLMEGRSAESLARLSH